MAILNFEQTPRKAFARGFLKGLAAPFELFRVDPIPDVSPPQPIAPPTKTVQQALASDWLVVGNGIRDTIRHEQAKQAQRGHGRSET